MMNTVVTLVGAARGRLERSHRQRGQTLVLFALALTVIIGALALIIDIGFAYGDRRYQQDGADAAALEAARKLALTDTYSDAFLRSEINRLVALNCSPVDKLNGTCGIVDPDNPPRYLDFNQQPIGIVGGGSIPTGPGNTRPVGVQVTTRKVHHGFFSWIVGQPDVVVRATGVAMAQRVWTNQMDGLIPLTLPRAAIPENCLTLAVPCTMSLPLQDPQYRDKYNALAGGNLPSNFKGVVSFDLVKAPDSLAPPCLNATNCNAQVEYFLSHGLDAPIENDDITPLINGDLGNNIRSNLLQLFTRQGGPWQDANGRWYGQVSIPVFEDYIGTGPIIVKGVATLRIYLDDLASSPLSSMPSHLMQTVVSATDWNPTPNQYSVPVTVVRLVPQCPGISCSTPGPTITPVFPTRTPTPVVPTSTPVPPTSTPAPTRTPKK